MHSRLLSGLSTARAYEAPSLHQAVREAVPWERLREEARQQLPAVARPPPDAPPDLAELKALLHWFKHAFFRWVDRPACEQGGGPTELIGMGVPTPAERAGGAARVELYRGPTGHITRFPRYHTTP